MRKWVVFLIQQDEILLTVVASVERNPLRVGLVERAEDWRWSSLDPAEEGPSLDPGTVPLGPAWVEFMNTPMIEAEAASIRLSLRKDRPYGGETWTSDTARVLGLECSLRPRGRQPRLAATPRN